MLTPSEIKEFQESLLSWFAVHQRDLPWRRSRDPYTVWVSEIMLQQTRVTAAIPYYEQFLERFPTVAALADAPQEEVLAQWAGLGYYYRARHLQKAAKQVRDAGAFPARHELIRELPGVGEYTAAAIASISFGLPHAVVDGNVYRVLSRVLNDSTNIASSYARKHFTHLAQRLLDVDRPGAFNQAVMELGAIICLPKNPQCLVCPVGALCQARALGRQNDLPVKIIVKRSVKERRTVFWIERDGKVLLWQRPATARLMPGFWELPERDHLPHAVSGRKLGSFRHGITFHSYTFDVAEAEIGGNLGPCRWVHLEDIEEVPVSTIVRKAYRVAAAGTGPL